MNVKPSPTIQEKIKHFTDPMTDQHRLRVWCKVMRLTQQEGLEFMKNHGYPMKKDRYNHLITEVNKIRNKRTLYELQFGFIDQHFAHIDALESLMLEAKKDYNRLDANNPKYKNLRKKIREEIAGYFPLITSYKEKTQYVIERQNLSKKLAQEVGFTEYEGELKITPEIAKRYGITDYEELRGDSPQTVTGKETMVSKYTNKDQFPNKM